MSKPVLTLFIDISRTAAASEGLIKTKMHTPTSCSQPNNIYLFRFDSASRKPRAHARWFVVLKNQKMRISDHQEGHYKR